MKKIFTLSAFVFIAVTMNAQVFWTENFGVDNNCSNQGMLASSYTGTNGAWTIASTGTNDAQANQWFVSATEAGMGVNNCGDGCGNNASLTNRTLHVGANDGLVPTDPGASYDAGGLCPQFACVVTNRRAESPVINCTGKSFISIAFNYMENGQGTTDNATLWYYDGAAWSQLFDLAKTPTTCSGGQGKWTAYSMSLPLSASNNAGVKIGFSWTNNDDGVGTDPSFAVDDVTISSSPSGVNEAINSSINVTVVDNDVINVQSTVPYKFISVNDVVGRIIKSEQEGSRILSHDKIPGIYFVNFEIEGVRVTKKVYLQ